MIIRVSGGCAVAAGPFRGHREFRLISGVQYTDVTLKCVRSQIHPAHERTQCCCRPSGGDPPYHLCFLRRAGGPRTRHRHGRHGRHGRPEESAESVLDNEMSKIRTELGRYHVRLPTLASRLVKLQEAMVDHHAEPIAKVDRRISTAIGVCSQTRQYRRRTTTSPASFQETAQEAASLWYEHLDDDGDDEEETAFYSEATISDGFALRGGRRGIFSRVA